MGREKERGMRDSSFFEDRGREEKKRESEKVRPMALLPTRHDDTTPPSVVAPSTRDGKKEKIRSVIKRRTI